MIVLKPIRFPLTKEAQVGHFGRTAKRRERYKLMRPGTENQLLKDAVEYLVNNHIPYIRFMEDWQWEWFVWNAPKPMKDAFSDLFSGWADLIVFKKMDGVNWNKTLPIELKSEGRKPRKNQAKRAKEINTSVITSINEFVSLVEEFIK